MKIGDELYVVVTQGTMPQHEMPAWKFTDLIMHDRHGIMMSTDKTEIETRFQNLYNSELQTYSIKKIKLTEIPA
tara:strand:+ start:1803 stop:2024 length:222 start_codon:yes stop_codon:yes gene_type:complete